MSETVVVGQDGDATNQWVLLNTKECPNPKCEERLEKNAGCDHMVCGKHAHGGKMGNIGCGFSFCWLCERPYDNHDYGSCQKISQQIKERSLMQGSKSQGARELAR